MDTKMKNTRDIDIYVNLANTLIRATKQKTEIARIILNVEDVLKKAEKQYAV